MGEQRGRAPLRGVGAVALLFAAMVAPTHAAPNRDEVADACRGTGAPAVVCGLVIAAEDGLARPGLSFGDFSSSGERRVDLEIADFYFRPRLARVRDGQTIVLTNSNPAGGNRHSVSSSDWGGARPVLPGPVAGFGGGRAFRSGVLDPGATFTLAIDIATMNPEAYVPLPNGDHLISFFCYIHGSSQMSGQLLVSRAP